MLSFLFPKEEEGKSFGVNINSSGSLPSDIEKVKGTIQKANKKYREEFSKYKEIAKFNQQLSNGYIRNLQAIVDVSKVLAYYMEVFNMIKEEYRKNEEIMGTAVLKAEDIAHLENLTRNKIENMNQQFNIETDRLKKLYTSFGKTVEVEKLSNAQLELKKTTDMANATYSTLRRSMLESEAAATAQFGGKKKKTRATKKKAAAPVEEANVPPVQKPKPLPKKAKVRRAKVDKTA